MNVFLLNRNFETIDIIDDFQSFIWSDRFCEVGDFELYISIDSININNIELEQYIYLDESQKLMIVSGMTTQVDPEQGIYWIVTGESLEALLKRRIVWGKTTISGNFQNAIKSLITNAFIAPSIPARKVSNFIFKDSTDPKITSLTIDDPMEYNGEDLYTVVTELCSDKKIGYKITLDDSHNFVFELYSGTDRSYNQNENPYVVFSPRYDNLFNSNYLNSSKDYKNVALAYASQGDTQISASVGTASGLDRREIAVSTSVDQDTVNKTAVLTQKANEELADHKIQKKFEGEVDSTMLYVYGRDYFLGDVVQLSNEYGQEGAARVDEMVFSFDTSYGMTRLPTFTSIDDEEE